MNAVNAKSAATSTRGREMPRKLGKYRLLAKLGEGGMAEVFVGYADEQTALGRLVVLKVLREDLAADAGAVEMFLDEARLASRLRHANVVHVYEAGAAGSRYAIVMEYLSGVPVSLLCRRVASSGSPLEPGVAMRILTDALRGLHYAHELRDEEGHGLSVVHRDFTLANIFLTVDGHIKVLDFGISKARDHLSQTREGFLKGTAGYIAPESIAARPIDRRADIFAAGVVLWSLLAGRRIWRGVKNVEVLQRTLAGEFPSWPEGVTIDPMLERICRRAMARNPGDRFGTAEEMRAAIREAMSSRGGLAESERVAEVVDEIFGAECNDRSLFLKRRLAEEREGAGPGLVAFPEFSETSQTTGSAVRPVSEQTRSSGSERRTGKARRSQMASATVPAQTHAAQRKSQLGSFVAMGLVAAAVAGGIVFVAGGHRSDAAPDESSRSTPVPAAAPVAPVAPEPDTKMATVMASAAPRHAKIYLDNRLLPGNPVEVQVPSDAEAHELRFMARGYQTETLTVRLTGPVNASIALEKLAADDKESTAAERTKPKASRRR